MRTKRTEQMNLMDRFARIGLVLILTMVIGALTPQGAQAAITYFGSASTPADNGASATDPTVVTPPASMAAGDLVLLFAWGSGTTDPAISETGGQTWNALALRTSTSRNGKTFWARFNGTWSANPSVTMPGAANNTAVMHVFRPTAGTNSWAVDVAEVTGTHTGAAVSITGITTLTDGAVAIAAWTSADDNTWGTLTGAGWSSLGTVQYRNTSGTNDCSQAFAYNIMATAGATGNVSLTQSALGPDAGTTAIIAFKETTPLSSSIASCEGCHGYTGNFPDGTARNTPAGQFPGSHQPHVVSSAIVCSTCHVAPATETSADFGHRNGNVQMQANISGGSYSKGTFSQSNTFTPGNCTSVTCHGNVYGAGTVATPNWGTAADCTACHSIAIAATGPNTGGHSLHNEPLCEKCHNAGTTETTSPTTSHADGDIDIANVGYPANRTKHAAGSGYATCSAASCHGNVYGAGTAVTPTWGSTGNGCSACHGAYPIQAYGPNTGGHSLHNESICEKCHNTGTTSTTKPSTAHADGDIDIANVGYPADRTKHAAGSGYTTCSAASCHSNVYGAGTAVTPTWGTTGSGCSACHSIAIAATGPNTGGHAGHNEPLCTKCHNAGTTATTKPTTSHADGDIDIANVGYPADRTKHAAGSGYTTCSAASCHSNVYGAGTAVTPTWGVTGSGCTACHSVAMQTYGPNTGGHATHNEPLCTKCHSAGTTATTKPTTSHADGDIDIANVGYPANRTKHAAGSGYTTCSAASCHSNVYGAGTAVTPTWGLTGNGCSACHSIAIGADGPATGSHTAHGAAGKPCTTCHSAGTTATTKPTTSHADGDIDIAGYGYPANVAKHTAGSGYSSCSTAPCHGTATWGGPSMDCISCHSASLTKSLGSGGSIRRVVGTGGDFNMGAVPTGSRHLFGATTIVKWDCIICHLEGQSSGANAGRTSTNHNDATAGLVHLRNVDTINEVGTGWAINNRSWGTSDYQKMDEFCVSCHDSDGASAIAVNAANNGLYTGTAAWNTLRAGWKSMGGTYIGRAAFAPFNSTDWRSGYLGGSTRSANAGEGRAHMIDIKKMFYAGTAGNWATTNYNGNPSQHAVLGTRYGRAWNTWTATAWASYYMKKSRANINSMRETALLTCADCHVLDAPGVGGNAHGGARKYNLWASSSDRICLQCHSTNVYANASAVSRWNHSYSRGGYNAYGLANADEGSGSDLACMMCHAGYQTQTTISRQNSYGGIHGSWSTLYPMSTVGSGNLTSYRFFPGTWRKHSYSSDTQWGSRTASTCYFGPTSDGFSSCTSHGSASGRATATYTPTYTRPVKY